jgi:hypothetical protein
MNTKETAREVDTRLLLIDSNGREISVDGIQPFPIPAKSI